MITVNIGVARRQLSRLIDRAAAGEKVIIARAGKPVARLTRLAPARSAIRFGALKGKIKFAPDFDAPLGGDLVKEFE